MYYGYYSDVTTYDYDAPISEAGDARPKFFELQNVYKKYVPIPPDPVPPPSPKGSYGVVNLTLCAPLLSCLDQFENVSDEDPIGMESLGYGYGYVFYQTILENQVSGTLQPTYLQDKGLVYLDRTFIGTPGWGEIAPEYIQLDNNNANSTLSILVENKGRPSGEVMDFSYARKGINGSVLLAGSKLSNWISYKLPMTADTLQGLTFTNYVNVPQEPTFYSGQFTISGPVLHTFLLVSGWGNGFVMINDFNIGRFTELGPQLTLYVPASILKAGLNKILVFESNSPANIDINSIRFLTFINQQQWMGSF